MKITYHIVTGMEGELGQVIMAATPPTPSLDELLSSMANLAFIVETVAHMQGKEAHLLPTADLARKQIAAFRGGVS